MSNIKGRLGKDLGEGMGGADDGTKESKGRSGLVVPRDNQPTLNSVTDDAAIETQQLSY